MKRDITMDEIVEGMARKINPEAWRVMDGYLAETERKYRGQNAAWPADQFKHKESLAVASATLTGLLTTANITEAQLIALVNKKAVVVPVQNAHEAPVSLLARSVRQTMRDYGNSCAESCLPDLIAADAAHALATLKARP